jgi:predicted extracellular nuclease
MKLKYPALLAALFISSSHANDLVITGVMDATLTGGTPKAVEIFVVNDIPDLSVCGLGSANNGGGTDGQEFTFEAAAAKAGSYLYVASESDNFATFMGFAPTHIGGSAVAINGDDSVELFCNDTVIDTFGDINVDGNGELWEYLDGWAYRNSDTGPDGAAFVIANWTFSGANALDGQATNDTATAKFPIKTFAPETSVFGDGAEVVVEEDPVLIGACSAVSTLISAVQGSGSASPLVGETHVIEGVVTAATPNFSGFFVQEETIDMDDNALTSEGIFVYYTGTLPLPVEGEVVRVLGDVSEFFDKTQISSSEILQGCGTDTASVADLVMPFASLDDIETLEGMLVASAQLLLVTNNYGLARYGQATLSSKRLYTPTNIYAPGSDEAIALSTSNTLDRIILDDGNSSQNPDSIPYPTGDLSAVNSLRLGDTVSTLSGVIDYSFGEYLVIPVIAPTFAGTNARTSAPDLDLGNLKVASLNVLNYFKTIDNGDNICGPATDAGCRGADDDEEFGRQKAKIISAIVAMDADIVGLMEIENNGFDDNSAIADLVAGVNAEMGDGTYAILNPGAPIGTDAITVAFIYKPTIVTLEGDAAILTSANSASDDNGVALFDDTKNRPSLVQQFALVENGETIVISVNHLKSKGSSCGAGDDDETTGQGSCNLTRTRAAQALTTFIANEFPDAAALIIGDLNAYAKEDPITSLEESGYTNIVNTFVGAGSYSYSFDGFLGNLDHALANESALAKTIDVTEWHINADEPIALDYNTRFKTDAQIISFYASDAYRSSDHDPVLVSLQLDAPNVAPTITSANTATAIDENSGAGQVVYTITSTDNGNTATVYNLKVGDDDALFTIDSTTGDVTLTANPDYETKVEYLFTVVATDAENSSSEQAVTLNINDAVEEEEEEPVANRSSGGSFGVLLFGLLTLIRIRRKK